jgi:hypothetical protein
MVVGMMVRLGMFLVAGGTVHGVIHDAIFRLPSFMRRVVPASMPLVLFRRHLVVLIHFTALLHDNTPWSFSQLLCSYDYKDIA